MLIRRATEMTFPEKIKAAWAKHETDARKAHALFKSHCADGCEPPRVPGMDTVIRLAWRIECGCTPEEAAAKEYGYRWMLAVSSDCLGYEMPDGRVVPRPGFWSHQAPHALGL